VGNIGTGFSPWCEMTRSLKRKKPQKKIHGFRLLTDQGSNLDSSEPKSDVLPITPSVNSGGKINEIEYSMRIHSIRIQ
jgi:hypothetical protein